MRKLWDFITTCIVFFIVLIAVFLAGLKIAKFTPYVILSSSMEPLYKPGHLVYVQKEDVSNIEVGDIIAFRVKGANLPVIHRVDEIDNENLRIYTKGDANKLRDANYVDYGNVVGVAKFSIPKLGYVATYFNNLSPMYLAVILISLFILLFIVPTIFRYIMKNDKKLEELKK